MEGDPLRTRGGQELAPRAEAAAARAGGGARGSGPHPQQLLGEVPALVDAAVHGDKALGRGLVAHVVVVQAGVEHDDGEGQHVARVWKESGRGASAAPGKAPRAPTPRPPAPTCGLEDARVAEAVAGRERLHHAVDFLRLAGESEAPQELPAGKREPGGGAAAPPPAPARREGGRGKAAGRGQGPSALHPPPAAAWRNPRGSGPEAGGCQERNPQALQACTSLRHCLQKTESRAPPPRLRYADPSVIRALLGRGRHAEHRVRRSVCHLPRCQEPEAGAERRGEGPTRAGQCCRHTGTRVASDRRKPTLSRAHVRLVFQTECGVQGAGAGAAPRARAEWGGSSRTTAKYHETSKTPKQLQTLRRTSGHRAPVA